MNVSSDLQKKKKTVRRDSFWNNLSNDLQKGKRSARRDYSASLMSNTKWRELFFAIEQADIGVNQIIVKFINSPQEHRISIPGLWAPHAYVDSSSLGPFPLVEIEWLEFPRVAESERGNNLPPRRVDQDIRAIMSTIQGTGKLFVLEEGPRGLRVIGHKP